MPENIYRELQKRLDQYSVGFPETGSGVEIKILKKLFSVEDAEMFLSLNPKLETPESVAERLAMSPGDAGARLEDMANRGLLFRLKKDGSAKYGAIPFIHGIFEFQVKSMNPELAELMEKYFEEGLDRALIEAGGTFLRTVPVEKSLDVELNVASFDDAVEILKKNETIVVTDCICRKTKEMAEESCGKPLEVCFMFGSMAKFYLDNNMGRQVDVNEAVKILRVAQDSGLITQPSTSQNPNGMCNCCGDCCGVLASIKKDPKPGEIVYSNHYACVDPEECIGCAECIEHCHMDAIEMNDDIAEINVDRCIGCGLCVPNCPAAAIKLLKKPGDKSVIPPGNAAEQMMTMAKKRGLIKG